MRAQWPWWEGLLRVWGLLWEVRACPVKHQHIVTQGGVGG